MAGSDEFDTAAAVTRSMLGWGVVAGPFYLVTGLVLALTRPGFDLSRHALSQLVLGEHGWLQTTNLVLSGLMTLVAAVGVSRALRSVPAAALIGVYGLALLLSAVFPSDPVAGFPVGAQPVASLSGVLHLVSGAVGFVALTAAAFAVATWFARHGERTTALVLRAAGAVVLLGFAGGAALATRPVGIGLLWLAVVAGWFVLLVTSVRAYRVVPHPDVARRAPAA